MLKVEFRESNTGSKGPLGSVGAKSWNETGMSFACSSFRSADTFTIPELSLTAWIAQAQDGKIGNLTKFAVRSHQLIENGKARFRTNPSPFGEFPISTFNFRNQTFEVPVSGTGVTYELQRIQ
jgi:hypothetical protein